jgi:hypothetical protein
MFGANSEWYYKYLAGILLDTANGGRGFDKIILAPQVWTPQMKANASLSHGYAYAGWKDVSTKGICPRLSSVTASMETTRGTIKAAWACAPPAPDLTCALVRQKDPAASIRCPGTGSTIDKIVFASYGTPTGNCSDGFTIDPACHSNRSMAKVKAACLGKSSCSINAGTPGPANSTCAGCGDPCFGTVKQFAVKVHCSSPTTPPAPAPAPVFSYAVTIPVGSTATVRLPGFGAKAAAVAVTESGKIVFTGGSFVPAAVQGVSAGMWADAQQAVELTVGSGTYSFEVIA